MCYAESMEASSRSPLSPQAPPFSPITPQSYLTASATTPQQANTSLPILVGHPCLTPLSSASQVHPHTPSTPLATSSPIAHCNPTEWAAFKLVIDNIDMNLRPRHQTFERQTQSIHYVNAYAVRDRIDFSRLENRMVNLENNQVSAESLYPSAHDHSCIMANFAILAGRILHESIPALNQMPNLITQHIKHPHYKEMSSKSITVSELAQAQLHIMSS